MAEQKHTPGPWQAWQERAPSGPWHVGLGGQGELTVGFLPSGEPDEGNARLIAAAPELLEALKGAREELRMIRMKDTDAVYNPTIRMIIDMAIAKAEGR